MSKRPVSTLDLFHTIATIAPVDGVARLASGGVRIDFKPEATPQQRQAANGIASGWRWDTEVEREPTIEERLATAEAKLATLLRP